MLLTIFVFLLVLSLLVLVHELGHYIAARQMGMSVEEFGFGFPPRLFGKKDRNGMLWSVNLIPLGGFVRIKGENGEKRGEHDAFAQKSIPARLYVLFAGVIMNFLLAWVLFTAGFMFGLPSIIEGVDYKSAIISNRAVNVMQVLSESPAHKAGLSEGDQITAIDGKTYANGEEARAALVPHADGSPVHVVFTHDGGTKEADIIPEFNAEAGRPIIGVAIVETGTVRFPFYVAPIKGLVTTAGMTYDIVGAFVGLIAGLFQHRNVAADLSGPIGIASLTGQVARLGFWHLVQFAALLSVNLAVLNAIPFPALDGGRALFVFVEAVRRKPNSLQFEQAAHTIGFALLILLVLFVTYKDIVKLF
ncbi:MAG: M50 family metallopeptidase [Patescibacteria group bacterium]|jgi:regulator of sigma E protease